MQGFDLLLEIDELEKKALAIPEAARYSLPFNNAVVCYILCVCKYFLFLTCDGEC